MSYAILSQPEPEGRAAPERPDDLQSLIIRAEEQ
jgi:hypothetical protein